MLYLKVLLSYGSPPAPRAMAGNAEAILQRLLPIVPLLVRWCSLSVMTCIIPPSLPPSLRSQWVYTSCSSPCEFIDKIQAACSLNTSIHPSPSSYSLYDNIFWLPAFQFSHIILFIVGLWTLLDKESVEAVITVSVVLLTNV